MKKLQPQTEVKVDDEKYIVQLYPPNFGLTLYAKLLRLLGEPIVKVMVMVKGNLNGAKIEDFVKTFDLDQFDLSGAADVLQSLFSGLKDEEFVPLIQEILSSTFIAGELTPVNDIFDSRFAGQYSHLFQLVAKTLGVQYSDFLPGLVKRANAAKSAQAIKLKAAIAT